MMDVHCFSSNYIVMFTGVYQDIQLYIRTSMIFGSRSWCRPSQSQPQHPSCVISAPGTFLQTPQIMSKCRWKLRWQYEKIESLIGDIYIFKSLEFSSPVRFRGCSATEDSRDFQPKTKKTLLTTMEWPVVSPRATWRQTQCEEEGSAHRNGGSHYEKQVWHEILQQYGWPQRRYKDTKRICTVTGLKSKIWGFLDFAEDLVVLTPHFCI